MRGCCVFRASSRRRQHRRQGAPFSLARESGGQRGGERGAVERWLPFLAHWIALAFAGGGARLSLVCRFRAAESVLHGRCSATQGGLHGWWTTAVGPASPARFEIVHDNLSRYSAKFSIDRESGAARVCAQAQFSLPHNNYGLRGKSLLLHQSPLLAAVGSVSREHDCLPWIVGYP